MATTGVMLRRDTKANLILNPPVTGEFVYATDTGEHGWLDETSTLVWKKLNEAVLQGGIVDYQKEIISQAGDFGPLTIKFGFSVDKAYVPVSISNHKIFIEIESISGNSIGYKSPKIYAGFLSLSPYSHDIYSFTQSSELSYYTNNVDIMDFEYFSQDTDIFNDNGGNDGVAGTFKVTLTAERIVGDETDITEFFNSTVNDYARLAGGG